MQTTLGGNSQVDPVFAGVLATFSRPPTTAYRPPHPFHSGHSAFLRAVDAAPDGALIPVPIQTAEDMIDSSRAAPLPREFVGNETYNKPLSSPGEDAGAQGRTAAPASSDPLVWKYRCTVLQRTNGFDAMSPGGRYWLSHDGTVWCEDRADTPDVGAFRSPLEALDALDRAPKPADADNPVTAEYVRRPKDAGAIALQDSAIKAAREAGCTEQAADKKHMTAKERAIANEPSHYIGATGIERTMREAEYERGQLNATTAMHLLAINATNLEVLREQIRREMMHRQHIFSEINTGVKTASAA